MKKFMYLLMPLFMVHAVYSQSNRYREEVFTDVKRTENIVYGVNATAITLPQYGQALPQPLVLDLYEPVGDNEEARPLIIFFHSGNFLPYPYNQSVVGTIRDSSAVAFCMKMARCGYVVASADYRLGWNPVAATDAERRFGIINAAYRGMQDARTCIRFFRESAQMGGNPYRICEKRIGLFGDDTGGYLAVHAAVLDNYSKILEDNELYIDSCGSGHFIPMIIPEINGDVTGKTIGINPAGCGHFPVGDTLCYPNHTRDNSSFKVAVNLAGAVAYKQWIEPGQPPIISVQTKYDDSTPYDCGDVLVGHVLYVINVCGAHGIAQAEEAAGNNSIFDNIDHYFVNDFQRSVESVALARNEGSNCLFPVVGDTVTDINPWDFWDRNKNGGDSLGILLNPHMSREKAESYMDSILAYVLPRVYVAMELDNSSAGCSSSSDPLLSDPINVSISPNPSSDEIEICTPSDKVMREVRLLNATGSLVSQQKGIDKNDFRINVSKMVPGMYIVQIRFDEGITARQIIVQ